MTLTFKKKGVVTSDKEEESYKKSNATRTPFCGQPLFHMTKRHRKNVG